jgi:hypothetical protein
MCWHRHAWNEAEQPHNTCQLHTTAVQFSHVFIIILLPHPLSIIIQQFQPLNLWCKINCKQIKDFPTLTVQPPPPFTVDDEHCHPCKVDDLATFVQFMPVPLSHGLSCLGHHSLAPLHNTLIHPHSRLLDLE